MLKIAKKGDDYTFERLFYITRGSQVHNPILHEGHLYLLVNENWNHQRRLQPEGERAPVWGGAERYRQCSVPACGNRGA